LQRRSITTRKRSNWNRRIMFSFPIEGESSAYAARCFCEESQSFYPQNGGRREEGAHAVKTTAENRDCGEGMFPVMSISCEVVFTASGSALPSSYREGAYTT
jgi:hypothetical protein